MNKLKKIAIIPARSGSKGLPNKNILMLLDKPLIAYTIEAAIKSRCFEEVIVSTDSLEYKEIAEQYGAKVLIRDKELASDTATSYMVIEDILLKKEKIKYDYFVLLQPTSPFRSEIHIKEAIDKFERDFYSYDFLVSMSESSKSADLIKIIDSDNSLKNYNLDYSNYRRQDGKEYYPNGAIFIGKIDKYLERKHFFGHKSLAYFMSKEDSIDIDERLDFEIAIGIANKKRKKELLNKSIINRIQEKIDNFNNKAEITLIGHSIFDYWDIEKIKNLKVNNLGIAGISTKEYIDYILNKNLMSKVGDKLILFAGTNDMVIENWQKEDTVQWIETIIEYFKNLNPNVEIYLIEVPRVLYRMDRTNSVIIDLNNLLKNSLNKKVKFIELGEKFQDKYGNLKLDYTIDGLHFNKQAYELLKEIIEKEL